MLEYRPSIVFHHMATSIAHLSRVRTRPAGLRMVKNAFYYTRPKTKKKGDSSLRLVIVIGGVLTSATATGIYLLGIFVVT